MPTPNLITSPFPIDYVAIRVALVRAVQQVTGRLCILAEAETQGEPRPPKPYMTVKFTSPGTKSGFDSSAIVMEGGLPTTKRVVGGQRKVTADFNCFGTSHEEAYNYMALWQSALETETIQEMLRRSGIALWRNGSVADLSALLNTGYEGRAQMQVDFGAAANIVEDLGEMDSVPIAAEVDTNAGLVEIDVTLTV